MGPQVRELEADLAAYTGMRHCITCASGTDALALALKALRIGPGDAVFVPDFTFFATAETVAATGAVPIFVDVSEDSFNMNPNDLESAVAETLSGGRLRPRAVIAVDLFGLPADYPAIRPVTDRYGLYLIEDGAQGFGGAIAGKRACGFGDISTTSFFPAKPLGCYGDGGAVFTDNDEWASVMASYRVHGKGENKYDNVRIGMNSRLDTLQAAILNVKFEVFQDELKAVNRAASLYDTALRDYVATPVVPEGFLSSRAQYTIRFSGRSQRDAIQTALREEGIPSAVYYSRPLHLQKAFEGLSDPDSCPVARRLSDESLSLPIHPYITGEEIQEVCSAVITAVEKHKG